MKDISINWVNELPIAITVTDAKGTIMEMNAKAMATFAASGGASLIGQNLLDCHPGEAKNKVKTLYQKGEPSHYTICKNGQRKIIHQLPWYNNQQFAGFVEISIPIPDDIPHFDRD